MVVLKTERWEAIRQRRQTGESVPGLLQWIAATTAFYDYDAAALVAVGKLLRNFVRTGDGGPELRETVTRMWQAGVPTAFKWPIHLERGRQLCLCSMLLPAFANGEVCDVFCIDGDITERERMNSAPCKSEEWPERIVLGGSDRAWTPDIDGHEIYQSTRFALMLLRGDDERGEDPRECWNRAFLDHTERMKEQLRAHTRRQADYIVSEYRLRCKNDTYRWLISRGLAMFDARRRPYGMAGSLANIAQLEGTGQSLSLSDSRKAAIFSSAVDPIIAMDRNGRIVEFNPAAERTFGYRASEVIGKSAVALITPADMQHKHQQALARLSSCANEGADRTDRVELRALRADGTDFPAELTITATDVRGAPLLIQFVRDITDRKEAEAVLLESEARLRLAAEAAEIGAWDWDAVSNALTCSDRSRALFGLPPEAKIDCALFYSRVHPEDRKRVRAAACAALNSRGTGEYAIDVRCVRPDGSVRWMSARGRAFFENRRGRRRPRRLIGIVRDITERKQREADLVRSNLELRSLSMHLQLAREDERARIARELHDEIGQNLTAILLHFEAMLRCEDSAISMRIEECSAIISQTFKAVHDLSLELRPPQLDISGLPASLRWMLDRQAKASGLPIEFSLDPSLGRLPPDLEITCFRVAQESVTNAVRHASATRLSVELFRCGAGLHLIVRDNGCGFEAAEASSEALRGSTFGLVSMRERVQCVGGDFELRSNRGRGTEVHARFSLEGWPEGT